jgi:hypothetical protein
VKSIPGRIAASSATVNERWNAALASGGIGPDEPYNAMTVLARTLLEVRADASIDLAQTFHAVESELFGADAEARNLIIVGLLEDLQNASLHAGVPLDAWMPSLGPTTLAAWTMLERLWTGMVSPAEFNAFIDESSV